MNAIRIFRHRFKGGITCEVTINLDKLHLRFEWSERPKPRVISEYRRWILSVLQGVANETGLKLMELLQVKRRVWECWVFEAGRAPVKVEEVSV